MKKAAQEKEEPSEMPTGGTVTPPDETGAGAGEGEADAEGDCVVGVVEADVPAEGAGVFFFPEDIEQLEGGKGDPWGEVPREGKQVGKKRETKRDDGRRCGKRTFFQNCLCSVYDIVSNHRLSSSPPTPAMHPSRLR